MRNYLYKVAVLLILGLVIQACSVGPNYRKPEPINTVSSFRYGAEQTDSIINLKWWELFNDPILDTLVVKALANNKNVLIAASRVEQARENVKFKKADNKPSINYNGAANRTNMLLGVPTNPASTFSVTGNASWEIDFWGKYRRSNEAAKADLLSSFYGKRAVQIAVITEVATNYFNLLDYRTQLGIAQKTYASRDSILQIIQARFDQGYTHVIDVNQAQIQKAIAQSAVPQLKRFVAFTENNLSVLLGESPKSIETYANLKEYDLPKKVPNGIPSDILLRRPDVLQAEQNYRSQNAYIGVAQAMRFPSISLTGLLGTGSTELSTLLDNGLGWGISAGITGPLFQFGKNARRVDIEREKAKQSLLTYEYTVLTSLQDVNNSLVEIETLVNELQAKEDRMRAANNASYLSSRRYIEGVTSYLEVIENQRQEFDAELSYSENFQSLLNAHVSLYKSLGGGWISQSEIDKYAQQLADEQEVDVSTINKDSLFYNGQIVDLVLSKEEEQARKDAKKAQRKLERQQKKEDRQNK
ncbi:efflux transporter outer membrane subunit [Urechidicola vernalis]|uniref:Efflux transporter outer membrane subunit n=1 Tax=Urechidicola vernalis TaxID=3075600 RepID=A0ABU2Y9E5_9FLAO|nr:efflux transporter outer membrane subunit [Urechidicola sp. P050]MDT0554279.1 efflux transporter outer membrane subunit [Urechidicola sp. P050]